MIDSQQQIAREAADKLNELTDGNLYRHDCGPLAQEIILSAILERELLSALAMIEKHNNDPMADDCPLIDVDLSLLREHDEKVHARGKNEGWHEGREHERKCQAEVRKPLVKALTTLQWKADAGYTVSSSVIKSIISDALAKVNE